MDLFKLSRVINSLQENYKSLFLEYKPFLGVSHFDTGTNLLFENRNQVKNWCRNFKQHGKLYFFVANTSTSDLKSGEHWFLIAFESDVPNVFYTFNSYGIVNTLKTFGYVNVDSESERMENNFDNVCDRRRAVLELSNLIWSRDSSGECCLFPKVIGYHGIHQDFSTDECGYHVLRFTIHLFENVVPKYFKSVSYNTNWKTVLKSYLERNYIELLPYESHKFKNKEESDNILLSNDNGVVNFVENHIALDKFVKSADLIEVHNEYNLSVKEWSKIVKYYKNNYLEVKSCGYFKYSGLVAEFNPERNLEMGRAKKGIHKRISKKPYKKEGVKKEKNGETDVDNERAMRTITSVSKMLIQELFPSNLIRCYDDPIVNNIQYSGMVENPYYLDNYMISTPGEEHVIISIREYFNSLNVTLDDKDPYTYTLAKLVKNYFEYHPEKKLSRQLSLNIQESHANRWRKVR